MWKIEIYYQLVVVPPIVTNITMHNSFLLVSLVFIDNFVYDVTDG